MTRWLILWAASLVLVAVLAVTVARAQADRADGRVISGADLGFRVEGADQRGRPFGRLVVRLDGKWVEVTEQGRIVPVR